MKTPKPFSDEEIEKVARDFQYWGDVGVRQLFADVAAMLRQLLQQRREADAVIADDDELSISDYVAWRQEAIARHRTRS